MTRIFTQYVDISVRLYERSMHFSWKKATWKLCKPTYLRLKRALWNYSDHSIPSHKSHNVPHAREFTIWPSKVGTISVWRHQIIAVSPYNFWYRFLNEETSPKGAIEDSFSPLVVDLLLRESGEENRQFTLREIPFGSSKMASAYRRTGELVRWVTP